MTHPNRPADITWIDGLAQDTTCPVCGHAGSSQSVLRARPSGSEDLLDLQRCAECHSLFFPGASALHYDDTGTDPDTFLQHYLEAGAGLWEMYWPTGRIATPERKTLLDVGCGFGWSVDIWNSVAGREGVGVELADWGRRGREALGTTIHTGHTSEVEAIRGRTFDVVYACEVIEHVADPYAFVEELKRYLAADGVLALTTPAAEFITPEHSDHEIVAQLCPGSHLFLFTRDSLARLLEQCGFEHVQVFRQRERLFAYASAQPIGNPAPNPELRDRLITYLRSRSADFPKDSPLYAGVAYRLIKEQVLRGQWAPAAQSMAELDTALTARFDLDFDNPAEIVQKIDHIATWTDWGRHLPYFMGSYAFFKAELALRARQDIHRAMEWNTVAIILGKHATRIESTYFTEAISLMWSAYTRLIQLAAHQDRIDDALALAEEMAAPGADASGQHNPVRASLETMAGVLTELALPILAKQEPQHADALIDLCQRALSHPEEDVPAKALLELVAVLLDLPMRFEREDRLQGLAECSQRLDAYLTSRETATRPLLQAAAGALRKAIPKPQPAPQSGGALGNPLGATRWSGWRH